MTRIFQVEEMTGERTFDSTTNGVPGKVEVHIYVQDDPKDNRLQIKYHR